MKKFAIPSAAFAVLAVPALAAVATSGLNVGESVSAFHPKHIAGPLAGTDKCFPCTYQARPQVQVWVNGDSPENVAKVAKALEGAMEKYDKKEFKALVVFVTPESKTSAVEKTIKSVATQTGAKRVAMAIVPPTHEAIQSYRINLDSSVKNTVFVYRDWKVAKKFVNLEANASGLQSLDSAVAAVVR